MAASGKGQGKREIPGEERGTEGLLPRKNNVCAGKFSGDEVCPGPTVGSIVIPPPLGFHLPLPVSGLTSLGGAAGKCGGQLPREREGGGCPATALPVSRFSRGRTVSAAASIRYCGHQGPEGLPSKQRLKGRDRAAVAPACGCQCGREFTSWV